MRTEFVLRKVYEVAEKFEVVGPTQLAESVGVSKSTAQKILLKISKEGYGSYVERKGFILNERGVRKAIEAIRLHRLIECLLYDLGVSKVCEEAEKLESVAGEEFFRALEEKYGDRRVCPCGKEIPRL